MDWAFVVGVWAFCCRGFGVLLLGPNSVFRSVLDEGEIAKLEATIERKALLTGFQDFLKPVGNDPVFHKSEDVTSNTFVLLVDAPLSAPGRVVEWIFAAVRECELAFQVWRPGPGTPRHFKADAVNGVFIKQANSASGGVHNYSLVGESKISMRHKGVYQVPLQPHQFIHVRPGDVLGFISYPLPPPARSPCEKL